MIYKAELEKAGSYLIRHRHNLSVAESVTAGLLQNTLANIDNASYFFEGGITAYNIRQKANHLFIDPVHAIQCNCVSEKIAQEMSLGISRSFKTNWGIGITGYAAPIPEADHDDLYACYAFSFGHKVISSGTITAVKEEPEAVQRFYLLALLEEFIYCCNNIEIYK